MAAAGILGLQRHAKTYIHFSVSPVLIAFQQNFGLGWLLFNPGEQLEGHFLASVSQVGDQV